MAAALLEGQTAGKAMQSLVDRSRKAGHQFRTPLFCLGEFWRVATEPGGAAKSPAETISFLRSYLRWAPATPVTAKYSANLLVHLDRIRPRGAAVFDVAIGLSALSAGCDELWTFDQHFPDLPGILIDRRPLVRLL